MRALLNRVPVRRRAVRLAAATAAAMTAAAAAPPAAEACADLARLLPAPQELMAIVAGGDGGAAAIEDLRLAGPAAVEALLAAAPPETDPGRGAWERALDAVCAQRDCAASGLYWYTDLESAVEEAWRSDRPILSLRLLGRLDEELSCANSRFFRTVLYADPEVAGFLRERFVLHWESVRPVPRLTIDFGDGRRLEGTITGNSVHYVLDHRGRLVDALPGLYGPGIFLDRLAAAGAAASELASAEDAEFAGALRRYHRGRLEALDRELAWAGGLDAVAPELALAAPAPGAEPPDAREAQVLTMGKALIEMPVIDALWWGSWQPVVAGELPEGAAPFDWSELAAARRPDWRLSDASRRLLLAKHRPADPQAARRVVAGFEELVGLDTVRNEYLLHAVVHRWLEDAPADPAAFTERIYAGLFLTPSSDPWLGLVGPDTYLALEPAREPEPGPEPEPEPEAIRSSAATIARADGAVR